MCEGIDGIPPVFQAGTMSTTSTNRQMTRSIFFIERSVPSSELCRKLCTPLTIRETDVPLVELPLHFPEVRELCGCTLTRYEVADSRFFFATHKEWCSSFLP